MARRFLLLLFAVLASAAHARAEVLHPLDEALAQVYPGARIERRLFALTPAELQTVQRRAHARSESRLVTAYLAWQADTLAGTAYVDRRVVRTREAVILVALAADRTVARVEMLAFFEPPDYLPSPRWLALFTHRRAGARLVPGRDVPNLAGATLTSRAVSESVRLVLAWHEQFFPGPRAAGAPDPH